MIYSFALGPDASAFLSAREVSLLLGIAIISVYRLVARRELPVHRFVRRLRFRRDDLLAWANAHRMHGHANDVCPSGN